MFWKTTLLIAAGIAGEAVAEAAQTLADFHAKSIEGKDVALSDFKGKVVLVVNVASKCGHTGQYAGLETLYSKHKDSGLVVLGFPANDFLWQEPGTDAEIRQFCSMKYNVTFPLFSKIHVKGDSIAPVYKWLIGQKSSPVEPGKISWNFEKFVIGRDGKVAYRFSPSTTPDDPKLIHALESELAKPTH